VDQRRLVERLFYFDLRAVLFLENLVDFLPEIAHMIHLAFLGGSNIFTGSNIFVPIIPAQTFNFQ